jgi:hypothetical protein
MLRIFAAFLLMFSVLGLIVHLDGPVHWLGIPALLLLTVDLWGGSVDRPHPSKIRRESLL